MNSIWNIKGSNYLPMTRTSHMLPLSMVPVRGNPASGFPNNPNDGFFSLPNLQAELDEFQRHGINSLRVLGSFMSWYIDPTGFLQCMQILARECYARRIGITYQVWSAVPHGYAVTLGATVGAQGLISSAGYSASTLRANLWTGAETYQTLAGALPTDARATTFWAEPLAGAEWTTQGAYGAWADTTMQAAVGRYLVDIGQFFANDPYGKLVFDSYDLYNEVNVFYSISATVKTNVKAFILATYTALRAQHANAPECTVGWAGSFTGLTQELWSMGVPLTYLSFHCYDRVNCASLIATAKTEAGRYPVMITEFHDFRNGDEGNYSAYINAIIAAGIPAYSWCILRSNQYNPIVDGLVVAGPQSKVIKLNETYGHIVCNAADVAALHRWTGVS